MKPPKMMVYINPRLLLSIIFDKNNIENAQPIPPIIIAMVYSTVETLITFVAYLGSIGTNAEIAAPCSNIPGNSTRCRLVTSTICLSCSETGFVL